MEYNGIVTKETSCLSEGNIMKMLKIGKDMLLQKNVNDLLHVFCDFVAEHFLMQSMVIHFYNEKEQQKNYHVQFKCGTYELRQFVSSETASNTHYSEEIPMVVKDKRIGTLSYETLKEYWRDGSLEQMIDFLSIGIDYINQDMILKSNIHKTDSKHIQLLNKNKKPTKDHQLLKLSYVDTLTQIYNRRFYEEHLKYLNDKDFYPIGIIIADINSLKIFNDAFSHVIGDELIKTCAHTIRDYFSEMGTVSRIGGDEFAVLIPNCDYEQLKEDIITLEKRLKEIDALPIRPSISFGYALFSGKGKIYDTIEKAENMMYERKLMTSFYVKNEIIDALKSYLSQKDRHNEIYPVVHEFAEALNFSRDAKEKLVLLSEIHDIGEIGLNRMIFKKTGPLTVREKEIIHSHVKRGYRIVSASSSLNKIGEEMLSHHERWDGKGYPRMLKANEIPEVSRAFAIIDAYHAMKCKRPYRNVRTEDEILNELLQSSGKQFDPIMVHIFVENILGGKISKNNITEETFHV
ncbi:MAG: diguanylate cyclase [Clostridia bacterium]|nr:diguanylate cyclase [Clostridia bacterium]